MSRRTSTKARLPAFAASIFFLTLSLAGCLTWGQEGSEGEEPPGAFERGPAVRAIRLEPQPRAISFTAEDLPAVGNGTLLRALQRASASPSGVGLGHGDVNDTSAAMRIVLARWEAEHGEWDVDRDPQGPVVRWDSRDYAVRVVT